MIAYRCPKCHYVTAENALLIERREDGSLRCPNCGYVLDYEKRCKTCNNWQLGGCSHFELWQSERSNAVVKALFDLEKGPPWPDCRGWKPQEQKL